MNILLFFLSGFNIAIGACAIAFGDSSGWINVFIGVLCGLAALSGDNR